MNAILSTTYDDQYLFYLPIVTWSWNKLGVDVICFVPSLNGFNQHPTLNLVFDAKHWNPGLRLQFVKFAALKEKKATYAQCSRLYGAALPLFEDDEVLITGDVDMAVFNREYFESMNNGEVHVAGVDLVPEKQFPICYIAMSASNWRHVMWINTGESHQTKLDLLLGHLECEHFRGNYWAKDQESVYDHIIASGFAINKHYRAAPGTQFATRRADRDGWPENPAPDIIDAHLPRPGYTTENFTKILKLFKTIYPDEDFTWMIEYRNEYNNLLKKQL